MAHRQDTPAFAAALKALRRELDRRGAEDQKPPRAMLLGFAVEVALAARRGVVDEGFELRVLMRAVGAGDEELRAVAMALGSGEAPRS